ncbi:MAG: hypothetical protein KGH53_03455 [Candidatus Micrarchaeota archaeon]|nr:hypothetical protein [Candidatus Micrarchaeota archaeon]
MFERFRNKESKELEGASKEVARKQLTVQEIQEIDKNLKVAKESLLSMFTYVNFVYLVGGIPLTHMGERTKEQMGLTKRTYEELSNVIRAVDGSKDGIISDKAVKGFMKFTKMYEELTGSEKNSEMRDRASAEFRNFLLGIPVLGRSGLARLYLQVSDAERKVSKAYFEALKKA